MKKPALVATATRPSIVTTPRCPHRLQVSGQSIVFDVRSSIESATQL